MALTILGYTLGRQITEKNLNQFPAKVAIQRIKQDIQTWRLAVTEAEQEYYPFRVKMQQLFIDTVLNGHVAACIEKRKKPNITKGIEV